MSCWVLISRGCNFTCNAGHTQGGSALLGVALRSQKHGWAYRHIQAALRCCLWLELQLAICTIPRAIGKGLHPATGTHTVWPLVVGSCICCGFTRGPMWAVLVQRSRPFGIGRIVSRALSFLVTRTVLLVCAGTCSASWCELCVVQLHPSNVHRPFSAGRREQLVGHHA